ncbi:MAG TPA: flagellar export chaperone FliS [Verrucomicrobiae bacterium]|jgi:flagellar protein FliS|nr:flagellar export chaperone FliS [Verrucomicrobiae bacterium]
MHHATPWKSYRQIATQTAPPGQLILMLYEGAIRALERALPAFDFKDPGESISTIHNNLQRALDIVRELNMALNLEKGGDCATNLRRLYNYIEKRIWESNLKKNRVGVEESIGHLTVLRDAWSTMLKNQDLTPANESPTPSLVPA